MVRRVDMNKILLTSFSFCCALTSLCFSLENDYLEGHWYTPSGKTYKVLRHGQVGDKKHYYIQYITDKKENQNQEVLQEIYDLMTHYYFFMALENLKKQSFKEKINHRLFIEAVFEYPTTHKKIKSSKLNKNMNGIERIAKNNVKNNPQRLKALEAFYKKEYKKALKQFKPLKTEEKVEQDYVVASHCFLFLGARDIAKKQVEIGLKKFADSTELLNLRGTIAFYEGTFFTNNKFEFDPEKMKEAQEYFGKVLKLDPHNGFAFSQQITLNMAEKNYKEAEKNIENLEKRFPASLFLEKQRADVYVLWDKNDEGEKIYKMLLEKIPGDIDLIGSLAYVYHKQGKFDVATQHYKKALEGAGRGIASQELNSKKELWKLQLKRAEKSQPPQ